MVNLVKPKDYARERWARLPKMGGLDVFVFSGYARFTPPQELLIGTGGTNTNLQGDYVEYQVTDMLVGPHWIAVRQVCPMVVVAGHIQDNPDEADDMGYEVTSIRDIKAPVDERIELQLYLKVRGGVDGRIPSLAYHVTALGMLCPNIGNEGYIFPAPELD